MIERGVTASNRILACSVENGHAVVLGSSRDGGGEVEFMEFYRWWQSDETKALLGGAIHRMEKVKEMFDQLDDDMSGLLDREEVRNLAL